MVPEELRHRPTLEEINALPLRYYEGDVHLIRNPEQWREALPALKKDGILGFDTETRPTFRKGVMNSPSLIQLATADAVYLIQLGSLPFNGSIASILEDPDIIKVGVAIREDMRALAKIFPFTPAGIVDLGQLANQHDLPSRGLRTLAASLFGWRISKGPRCSNWSVPNLSPRQVAYAATDAWIGRLIYMRLKELDISSPGSDP